MTVKDMEKEIRKNLKGSGLVLRILKIKINGQRAYAFENEFSYFEISNMTIDMAYENTLNDFLESRKK